MRQDAMLDGEADQFGLIMQIQLNKDVGPVCAGRAWADVQLPADLSVCEALRGQLQHFTLPVGEDLQWIDHRRLGLADISVDHAHRKRSAKVAPAGRSLAYCQNDL